MNLSIPAWRDGHYISLAELLLVMGRFYVNSQWYLNIYEVAPEAGAEHVENIDQDLPLNIYEVLHAITPNIQIIDGEIRAKDNNKCCLLIRAVDSTSWDIETNDSHALMSMRQAYPESVEISDPM